MNRVINYVSRHKLATVIAILVAMGTTLRWEVTDVYNANTGQPIIRYRGIAFPWQPTHASWSAGAPPVNYHVHEWLCYGLKSEEARGLMP